MSLRTEGTTLCDLNCVGQCLWKIRKQLHHLVRALEEVLARQPAAIVLYDVVPASDTKQGVVSFVVIRRRKIDFIGRNERQCPRISQVEQRRLRFALMLEAVTLNLDVETIAEDFL